MAQRLTAAELATFAATVPPVVVETRRELSSTNSGPNVAIASQIFAFIEASIAVITISVRL